MGIRYFHLNPITQEGLNILESEFERVRQKHEDSDFGMNGIDQLDRYNETFFEDED